MRFPDRAELVVIAVQDNMALRADKIQHLRFGAQDPVPVAQKFQMSRPDIGDHPSVRSCDGRKSGHLSEMVDAHLQNSDLMLLPQTENSEGKTQFIVEIPLCFQGIVFL